MINDSNRYIGVSCLSYIETLKSSVGLDPWSWIKVLDVNIDRKENSYAERSD